MKTVAINFVIDLIAFAAFAFLTTTGVLLYYMLPTGSGWRATLWDMTRHEWGALHFWVAVLFFVTIALHTILHWKWIVARVRGRESGGSGWRLAIGVVGLLAIIALAASPLLSPVEQGVRGTHQIDGEGQQRRHGQNLPEIR